MRNAECTVLPNGHTRTMLYGSLPPPADCGRFGISNAQFGYALWFKRAADRDALGRQRLWRLYVLREGLEGRPDTPPADFITTAISR